MHSFAQDSPSTGGRDRRGTAKVEAYVDVALRPPAPPRHLVRRPRLLALLNELTEYPVVLVVAPAGSGKSTLVADWLRRSGRPSAWLTTLASDGSAVDLGSSLAAALQRAEDTGADTSPMTLVLDDVERLGDEEGALAVLTSLVERRPAWLRLVLIGRRRPPLPVDRLRASGDLADVTFDALRFSEEEAALLLTRLCPGLDADELVAAVERAGGWAAALQLTALGLQSRRFAVGPASGGSTEADRPTEKLVDEYLWEEVLRPERRELVGLVEAAAVVGRISYGLAEALTERPDAGDLLEEAEAAGLFLTALPDGWFALHGLVRDTLLQRLRRRAPDGLRKRHARAAQWFESRGDRLEALDHWLAAERPIDALRVLSEVVLSLLDAGDAARAADALARIPAAVVSRDPVDAVRYAWCQLAAGTSTFLDVLSVTESTAVSLPEPSASRLQTLRAASSWLRADWRHAATHARRVANQPAELGADDPIDCFGWRMIACGIALDERWDDRQPMVGRAWAASRRDPAAGRIFEGTRAVGLALAGHPVEASRVADGVRAAAGSGLDETLRIELALADAIVERELDHREAAAAILEDLAVTPTFPDPILQVVAQLELVRLRLDAGEREAAAAQLDESDRLHTRLACAATVAPEQPGTRSEAPPGALVARAGVELALAMDDPASALRWSEHVSDPFWGPACEARIELALGRHEAAETAVRRARPRCPRHQVVAGLLLAQALAPRDRSAAASTVTDTLDLAARHALLRTVAADGAPVMELVELAAWRVPETWMDRLRHALVPTWTGHDAQRPIEDLTDRERDVLRLLPSRLTLGEIASELFVSQNTLKFHLRAIYRKLGVESRAQAVDTARRMRLLPRG